MLAAFGGEDPGAANIGRLRQEEAQLNAQRKAAAKALAAAEKKRKRAMDTARSLSTQDLLEIVASRQVVERQEGFIEAVHSGRPAPTKIGTP